MLIFIKNFFVGFFCSLPAFLLCQNHSPSEPNKIIPLLDFLQLVEREHNLIFNYQANLIDTFRLKPLDRLGNISNILEHLRSNTPFDFIDRRPHIILAHREIGKNKLLKPIRGQIIDAQTKEPLPFSTIKILGSNQGVQADESGRFKLAYNDLEQQIAMIQFIGYTPLQIPLKELAKKNGQSIRLKAKNLVMQDILIKDQAILPVDFKSKEGYYDINAQQLQLQAGWGEPDVLRMLQIIPGIQSIDESSANLHIRGGTPDQNLLLIDDIPVYKPGHFFGFFSTLNSHIVDQVKVYKGGFGASYGGRASGVIDIKNKLRNIKDFQASFGINPINYHFDVSVPLFNTRSSILISARNTISDKFKTPLFKSSLTQKFQTGKIAEYRDIEEQELLNKNDANYLYKDFNLRWQYRFKKDDEITLSHFSNEDQFRYDFEIDQPSLTHVTGDRNTTSNRGSSLKITNRWKPWWQSQLHFTDSKFSNLFEAIYSSSTSVPYQVRTQQENSLEHNKLGFDQILRINQSHDLKLGLEINNWDVDFRTEYEKIWEDQPDTFQLNLSNLVTTSYLDYSYNYANQFFLQAGIRHNQLNGFPEKKWEPRLSIKYKAPSTPWLLKANLGTYYQFISQIVLDANEDNLGSDNGIWLTTELDVVPIVTSRDMTFGVTYQEKGWTVDLEVYRKITEGLSALNLRIDRDDGEVAPGESRASGLEMIIQKKFNQYRSLLTYNLAKVDYQFPDFNQRSFFPAPHDRRHYIQWNHMLAWKNFDFVLVWHLGSGLPYSVPFEILQIENEQKDEFYHELLFKDRNSERLRPYHRLDLSINYQWIRKKIQARASFSIFNLYARSNIIERKYLVWYPEEDRNNPDLTYFERRGLRATPSFFFTVTF